MSERIIVIVETIAVVILAIVVVIYAQVLWQRFQVVSETQVPAPTEETGTAERSSITDAERMEVLKAISETSVDEVTPDERNRVLETLTTDQSATDEDTAARMEALESLRGN